MLPLCLTNTTRIVRLWPLLATGVVKLSLLPLIHHMDRASFDRLISSKKQETSDKKAFACTPFICPK
ncbi:hypothetical protein HPP92_005085 [Vanilla planifolia]|uniref:Uncharacterized protein n=1 Tax=Vanilla planifolia TaxID=51239 RepID=A0A835RL16_VANPL|nr:hypothetical protein HPP92_005085 [Vanilla planifolia]